MLTVRSMNKKILFIVEGSRDSEHVQSVVKEMGLKAQVFPVNANIHMLYSKLEQDDFHLNIVDTLLELNGVNQDDKEMLKREAPFAYTYLLFDMDPQHSDKPIEENISNIEKMLNYFTNETDDTVGKLYINYPMIESLWDYDKNDYGEYKSRMVPAENVKGYKTLVGQRGNPQNLSKYKLSLYKDLCLLNIKKAEYIVNNDWSKPSYPVYLSDLSQLNILLSERQLIRRDGMIRILNSLPLFIVDYWGNSNGFYDSL